MSSKADLNEREKFGKGRERNLGRRKSQRGSLAYPF